MFGMGGLSEAPIIVRGYVDVGVHAILVLIQWSARVILTVSLMYMDT